jgi:hypothetical protein
MLVRAEKPITGLSRCGVAPNTAKEAVGAPANAAVIGRPVLANSCCQAKRKGERSGIAEHYGARQVSTEGRSQRVGGLLRHVQAQGVGAPFAEGGLVHAAHLQPAKRCERGLRGGEHRDLVCIERSKPDHQDQQNTSKIAIEGLGRSVPDVLQRGIREIKSGVEIDNSLQLKIQAAYAQLFRIPFSLIVSPNTQRLSKPVRDAVEKTGGTIQRFDPATGTFTPFQ